MIKNERQYKITKAQLEKFRSSLGAMETAITDAGKDPVIAKARLDAAKSLVAELDEQLKDYEQLRLGQFDATEVERLFEIPRTLIRARIARGISQKELAGRLGLKEQQIQRYEATDYASASVARILEIAAALGYEQTVTRMSGMKGVSLGPITESLRSLGLSKAFIEYRLLPETLRPHQDDPTDSSGTVVESSFVSRIMAIFGWSLANIVGGLQPQADMSGMVARFKAPANASPKQVTAYAVYAHYIALLVAQAAPSVRQAEITLDPMELRSIVEGVDGQVALKGVLQYTWRIGIPVVGLDDPGAFHGACFRISGRNVIVLKQRTRSQSRWIFDLLHEIWHAGQDSREPDRAVIEDDEMSSQRRDNQEERTASQFAGAVLLRGQAQRLAELCVTEAAQDLSKLKSAVRRVAVRQRVPLDALANYLAFRLSLDGHDWWGAASNLQKDDGEPVETVRNMLLQSLDLSRLPEPDRDFLLRALRPWGEEQQ